MLDAFGSSVGWMKYEGTKEESHSVRPGRGAAIAVLDIE